MGIGNNQSKTRNVDKKINRQDLAFVENPLQLFFCWKNHEHMREINPGKLFFFCQNNGFV